MDKEIKDKIDRGKQIRSRNHSALGMCSLIIGALTWVIFIALIPMAQSESEEIRNSVTGLGFMDLVLSLCGIIISVRSTKLHNDQYLQGLIGLILNTVMFFLIICMYLIGL